MKEPDNIVLSHLRAIREQLDLLNNRQIETIQRIGALELQSANLSMRFDRLDMRLDRTEKRVGLVD